jgi:hypothetical protein
MVMGNAARLAGIIIIMFEPFVSIVERFGNQHLDFRTPVFQIALLFFALAWGWFDHRKVIPSVLGVAAAGAIEADVPPEMHGSPPLR